MAQQIDAATMTAAIKADNSKFLTVHRPWQQDRAGVAEAAPNMKVESIVFDKTGIQCVRVYAERL